MGPPSTVNLSLNSTNRKLCYIKYLKHTMTEEISIYLQKPKKEHSTLPIQITLKLSVNESFKFLL